MRVLMITAFPPIVSPEVDHAVHLSEQLAAHGFDVHVLTQRGASAPRRPGVTVHPVMAHWSWRELPRLARVLRRCAPDVVLLMYLYWNYERHPMITFLPTVAKWLRPRARVVTLFEDADGVAPWAWNTRPVRAVRALLKRWAGPAGVDDEYGTLVRDSDRVVLVSDRVGAKLLDRFPELPHKCDVVHVPPILCLAPETGEAARQAVRDRLGMEPWESLLVYFGYIYPSKGVETLLQGFAALAGRRPDVRLLVLGGSFDTLERPGYLQEVQALPEVLGVADRVHWAGAYAWDSVEPSRCLRAADVCVLPYDDGVCVHNSSFAAAAAHGLPIVTTQGEVLEEPFVHGENVYLCPPQEPEALAAAVEAVLDDPGLREHLRAGALRLAEEWLSWDRAVAQMRAVFDGAV